jgi:hypothetical protein
MQEKKKKFRKEMANDGTIMKEMVNDGTIMLLAVGLGVAVLGGIVVLLSGKKEGPVFLDKTKRQKATLIKIRKKISRTIPSSTSSGLTPKDTCWVCPLASIPFFLLLGRWDRSEYLESPFFFLNMTTLRHK